MQPQFIDYNPCTIIINDTYTVTNIQTKGIPGKNSCAHLESLEIKAPSIDNPGECSSSGTVTLIDYQDSLFETLASKLKNFLETEDSTFLPKISITIDCFTGRKTWSGTIIDWSVSFVGTTPSLIVNWKSIAPSTPEKDKKENDGFHSVKFTSVSGLIDRIRKKYNSELPIVDNKGNDVLDKLKFKINAEGEESLVYNQTGFPSTGNYLIDAYQYVLSNVMYADSDGSRKQVIGIYDENKNRFTIIFKNPRDNTDSTEDGTVVTELKFVQNGSLKYYEADSDGRYVIPMTSFNYSAHMTDLTLQARIYNSPNGAAVYPSSAGQTSPNNSNDANKTNGELKASGDSASGVEVSFECYNVTSFGMYNPSEKVMYVIYNEFGQPHRLSGMGTVKECTYTLSGGVVRANITVTEVFGNSDVDQEGDSEVQSSNTSEVDNSSAAANSSSLYGSSTKEMYYEEYLKQEDDLYIPLSCDKTQECLNNGKFAEHVNEFLDRYGNLKSTARRLDYTFVEKLIKDGDFGLLSLLFAVANYGVTADAAIENWGEDPVTHDPSFAKLKSKPYCGSAVGKCPFDYKSGGLGIAHWDAENLQDIYSTCGFDRSINKDYFASLLIGVPEKKSDREKYTGKISGWNDGAFKGHSRLFPVFSGKCWIRRFDVGLKQDDSWLKWARDILYYNSNDGRIYQHYLFQLWVKKFWIKTMSCLKGSINMSGHMPCLQDAVRISRAANSKTKLINMMCGKNVSQQYDLYVANSTSSLERTSRQMIYCKRLCHILTKEYGKGNIRL